MKKFKIVYLVGTSKREKCIMAKDLEDAEKKANNLKLNWIDIYE